MLSVGEDVEASALSRRGWPISAIARHLDRDRKTVRSYLAGEREPGVRRPAGPDPLAPFAAYVTARFADDPHLWAPALSGEVVPLGYDRSYVSFARQLRLAGLRPHCEACPGVIGRPLGDRSVRTRRYPYVPSDSSNDFFTIRASSPRLFAVADSGAFRHS